ncbi:MAG: carbohydrate kinase family protein [Anaerolineaceae bacterium]|nr:carbohydrate kinase family protein [Anaerolineaceae bacterium]
MTVLCSGSIAYDYLMTFPGHFKDHILQERLETISLSFLVDSMNRQRGGTAPNIAYSMALLGDKPQVIGTVGEDFESYRAWLESKGVDTTYIKVIEGDYTASFFVNTDQSNAQIASFYSGAMSYAKDLSIAAVKPKPDFVIISPDDPGAMSRSVQECKDLGIDYLYDPSQQIVRVDPADLIAGVDGAHSLFVNEYECELLLKHTGLSEEQIMNQVQIWVVTCGNNGSKIRTKDAEYHIPVVKPEQILDPTGVGDAFRAGFVRGYRLGLDLQTCGQMGALAATYCLEQKGTQSHDYTTEMFVTRYRKHFDDEGKLDILL